MRRFQFLRKMAGTSFAFLALIVAQSAATQVCIIFHQEEIPSRMKEVSVWYRRLDRLLQLRSILHFTEERILWKKY